MKKVLFCLTLLLLCLDCAWAAELPDSVKDAVPPEAADIPAAVRNTVYAALREAAGLPEDQPLMDEMTLGGDLGLDSIDILEVALAVSKKYGFQLRADDEDNAAIYASLRSLTQHIAAHRTT